MTFLWESKRKIAASLLLVYMTFLTNINAESCKLDYSIMYLIASNEKHNKRPVGYPYQISLNNKRDFQKIKEYKNIDFIDTRTIDCHNKSNCVKIFKFLLKNNIKNIDVGAFQINYIYFKFDAEDYFDQRASYKNSCIIAQQYINPSHITFEDIARYHSSTKKYNKIYAKNLQKNYNKLLK